MNHNRQRRLASFLESFWNVGFGFLIAWAAWEYAVRPAIHNGYLSVDNSIYITCIFTVISLARGYFVRRCSVAWSAWRSSKKGAQEFPPPLKEYETYTFSGLAATRKQQLEQLAPVKDLDPRKVSALLREIEEEREEAVKVEGYYESQHEEMRKAVMNYDDLSLRAERLMKKARIKPEPSLQS